MGGAASCEELVRAFSQPNFPLPHDAFQIMFTGEPEELLATACDVIHITHPALHRGHDRLQVHLPFDEWEVAKIDPSRIAGSHWMMCAMARKPSSFSLKSPSSSSNASGKTEEDHGLSCTSGSFARRVEVNATSAAWI